MAKSDVVRIRFFKSCHGDIIDDIGAIYSKNGEKN